MRITFSRTIARNHADLLWERILNDDIEFNYTRITRDEYDEIEHALYEAPFGTGNTLRIICTFYWWKLVMWSDDDPEFVFSFEVPDTVVDKLNG